MYAAFELETRIRARPSYVKDGLFVPPDARRIATQQVRLPTSPFRVARVHTKQIGREYTRFIATCPSPDLDNHVSAIPGILRKQQVTQLALQIGQPVD